MKLNDQKVDDAVLAVLWLTLHDGGRAWKSLDWEAMDRLHQKGLISNPASKAKSVQFTEEGLTKAEMLARQIFV
jgi:hypothetical protein